MIKNCVFFRYQQGHEAAMRAKAAAYEQTTLQDCVEASQGVSQKRLKDAMAVVRKARLSIGKQTPLARSITLSCEFRAQRYVAFTGEEAPFVPIEAEFWQMKGAPLVVAFDIGRRLAAVGAALISQASSGKPSALEPIRISKDGMTALRSLRAATPRGQTAEVRGAVMQGVDDGKDRYKQVALAGPDLQNSSFFGRAFDSAKGVASLTVLLPSKNPADRRLHCRFTHWGGVTIYSPSLLPDEIEAVVSVMQRIAQKD